VAAGGLRGEHAGWPRADRTGMRILLIRLRQIGDVVFTTPALNAIRRRFPNAHLTYLVEPTAAPVVAGHPALDDLIVIETRKGLAGLAGDAALVRRLRAGRYDLAIDFHGGPRASLLAWLSGARQRLGYDVVGRGWMYTTRVHRPRALRPRHSVENQWDLLAALDIAPPTRAADPVTMPPTAAAVRIVGERLARAGVTEHHRLIVIHVSAGNPFRRWPMAGFVALASGLAAADPSRRVVLTAGPSDRRAAQDVLTNARDRLPESHRAHLLDCDDFSIAELRALVERAALFIGGDSGPLHVAATSQVPIVGLYGPTLPVRSEPWRSERWSAIALEVHGLSCRPCAQRVCEPGDFRCLGWIRPEDVLAAAERLLR